MQRRKVVGAVVGLSVTCVLVGCGSDSDDKSNSPTTNPSSQSTSGSGSAATASLDGKTVADIADISNAFVTCLQRSYLGGIKDAGGKSFTLFGQFDPSKSQQAVEDAISKRPDTALVLDEGTAVNDISVKKLQGEGIKTVLALAAPGTGVTPEATLTYDYEENAKFVVDGLKKLAPDTKKVGIIDGFTGVQSTDNTDSTLKTAFDGAGVSIVATLHSSYTSQGGATAAQDLLQSHPDVGALVVIGDDAGLAATRIIEASGKKIPVITLFTFTSAALDQVKTGQMLFVLRQPVDEWGKQISQAIISVSDGKKLPVGYLRLQSIDKSSVDSVKNTC